MSKGNPHNFSQVAQPMTESLKGIYEMTVPNLSADTVYYFRLVAVNKQGSSLPSRHTVVKTPDGTKYYQKY
jgi:hypothetical protein